MDRDHLSNGRLLGPTPPFKVATLDCWQHVSTAETDFDTLEELTDVDIAEICLTYAKVISAGIKASSYCLGAKLPHFSKGLDDQIKVNIAEVTRRCSELGRSAESQLVLSKVEKAVKSSTVLFPASKELADHAIGLGKMIRDHKAAATSESWLGACDAVISNAACANTIEKLVKAMDSISGCRHPTISQSSVKGLMALGSIIRKAVEMHPSVGACPGLQTVAKDMLELCCDDPRVALATLTPFVNLIGSSVKLDAAGIKCETMGAEDGGKCSEVSLRALAQSLGIMEDYIVAARDVDVSGSKCILDADTATSIKSKCNGLASKWRDIQKKFSTAMVADSLKIIDDQGKELLKTKDGFEDGTKWSDGLKARPSATVFNDHVYAKVGSSALVANLKAQCLSLDQVSS